MQVKGQGLIDIKMRPVVILAFGLPEMTEEEFFGKDLLKNLIIFLKVDPAKVRIAGVGRIGQSRRRKRGTRGIQVTIEIGVLKVFINSQVTQNLRTKAGFLHLKTHTVNVFVLTKPDSVFCIVASYTNSMAAAVL